MWVELKAALVNKSLSDLGIDLEDQEVDVRLSLNTDALEGYREVLNEEGDVIKNELMIYTKGNGTFIIKHSYDEFKAMI